MNKSAAMMQTSTLALLIQLKPFISSSLPDRPSATLSIGVLRPSRAENQIEPMVKRFTRIGAILWKHEPDRIETVAYSRPSDLRIST